MNNEEAKTQQPKEKKTIRNLFGWHAMVMEGVNVSNVMCVVAAAATVHENLFLV